MPFLCFPIQGILDGDFVSTDTSYFCLSHAGRVRVEQAPVMYEQVPVQVGNTEVLPTFSH